MPKRKSLRPGHAGYLTKDSLWRRPLPPPRPQPVRLPSTRQIDARIKRQTAKFNLWREQYLRRKNEGGRWWAGPRPKKPPAFVTVGITSEGSLVFTRPPDRRHPFGTEWVVPPVHHPTYGVCHYLTSVCVMNQQLLRTIPSRRLLVSRGPTPEQSVTFKALTQEWVRVPSSRSNRVGYHRWLCYLVPGDRGDARDSHAECQTNDATIQQHRPWL